jgi:hypothetical protein
MTNLLTDESPLQVLPKLAAEIGLNEAIVLQQVHYWITNTNAKKSVKTVLGQRWVKNSFEGWKENFPFWHIQTIKRVFLSLEKTGYLVSGHFNRTNGLDRTKWYTIDYDKLAPITDQLQKAESGDNEVTTRLYKDDTMETQIVQSHSQNGANNPDQNGTMEGQITPPLYQNDTTLIDYSKTNEHVNKKNKKQRSKSKRQQPDNSSASDSPKEPTPSRLMFGALAGICQINLKLMTDKQRGELNQSEKLLRESGIDPRELVGFAEYWYECDWRGKETPTQASQPPKPAQVREEWGKYQAWLKALQPEPAPLPDHLAERQAPAPSAAVISPERKTWDQIAEVLSGSMTKAAYEMHVKNALPICRANDTLTIQAASPNSYEIIKNRFRPVFDRAAQVIEPGLHLEFVLG